MRIVHVVESFGGGVIGFVAQLCRLLPQLSHTVIHAERAGEVDPAVTRARFPAGVVFVHWPHAVRELAPLADLQAYRALLPLLREAAPDVVHLHSSKAGFLGRIACRRLGIKAVVYTPGGAALLRQDISATTRALYGNLERVGDWFGGEVVACSKSEEVGLAAYGVKARVIANGVAPGSAPGPLPTALPLTVVATGRTTAQKHPALFAEIATKAQGVGLPLSFVWIGTGELDAVFYGSPVQLTGWVDGAGVKRWLSEASIYMSTSLWEGLSLAVLEAMAQGLPLLLSHCPGNTDVVRQGENGYTFRTSAEAVERLQALATTPALLPNMGKASRTLLVAEHDEAGVGAAYLRLYTAFVKQKVDID